MINIIQQRDLGRQIMSVGEKNGGKPGVNNDFRERMLLHNHLDGLLSFEITSEDNEKIYEFEIGEKYSLEEYFRIKSPDRETMTNVLRQLLETIYRGREYMLDENDYIIGPDTVFINDDMKVYLAYYPGYDRDLKSQLRDLSQYFMEKVDYTDESVVMLIYGFYMRTKESGCTFEELLRSLKAVQEEEGRSVDGSDWDNGYYDGKRDTGRTDSRRTDSGRTDSRRMDSERTDGRRSDTRRTDGRTDERKSDVRKNDLKKADSQRSGFLKTEPFGQDEEERRISRKVSKMNSADHLIQNSNDDMRELSRKGGGLQEAGSG